MSELLELHGISKEYFGALAVKSVDFDLRMG